MKTTRKAPRLHTAGTYVWSAYWRQWDYVIEANGPAYGQVVKVVGVTGPDAGRFRVHSTPLDARDIVRFPPCSRLAMEVK